MKKIAVYGVFIIVYIVLAVVLTSSMVREVALIVRFFVNLFINSAVLIAANLMLNYEKSATLKTSFIHALLLAVVACVIALTVATFTGNHIEENGLSIVNESTESIGDDHIQIENVQMEVAFSDQDTSSRIMQIVLDLLVAFAGGALGVRMFKRRNANTDHTAMV
ncbi:hypothetical protein LQZ18_16995 [Lachnospiraceae bacterium ZAX-1]